MAPISGLHIHYDGTWELMGDGSAEIRNVTRTYRRLWKSRLIDAGSLAAPGADPAFVKPMEVDEYIYLLIDAKTAERADTVSSILQAHIEDNISSGKPPDDVDFECPDDACSFIIRVQGNT